MAKSAVWKSGRTIKAKKHNAKWRKRWWISAGAAVACLAAAPHSFWKIHGEKRIWKIFKKGLHFLWQSDIINLALRRTGQSSPVLIERWTFSSAGRAFAWRAKGQRFESVNVHQEKPRSFKEFWSYVVFYFYILKKQSSLKHLLYCKNVVSSPIIPLFFRRPGIICTFSSAVCFSDMFRNGHYVICNDRSFCYVLLQNYIQNQ